MTSFLETARALRPQPPEPERTAGQSASVAEAGDLGGYLAKVCDGVATAANGTRNDTLNRAAYTLGRIVGAGQLDEHAVIDALVHAGRDVGLTEDEIQGTIFSGLRAGEQEPRALEARETATWPTTVTSGSFIGEDSASGGPADAASAADRSTHLEPDRTSWWPRPITSVIADREDEPDPTHLARTDGHRLFYSGRVNGILGESESGKTWVALHAVVGSLQEGQTCLYLDFEDSAKGIDSRLRLLSVTDAQLDLVHYANPDEALALAQHADLYEALQATTYGMVILDGVNAAMTVMGLNPDSSQNDATVFVQRLLRPLANTGAAVVTIDHVAKNKETRGKGGIGAQAKRAMTRGCALSVEVVQPFGPGMHGELRLTVDKDTPGKVRAVSAGARHAGLVHLDSSTSGITMQVEAPDLRPLNERGPFRPTHLMEAVSRFLETLPDDEQVPRSVIEKNVEGKATYLREACDRLVEEGHCTRSIGARDAVLHVLINPFRELL